MLMQAPSHSITLDLPAWLDTVVAWDQTYRSDQERITLVLDLALANVYHRTGGPFGAAVFDQASGQVLGVGVNRVVPLNNSTLHAEMLALMMAEKTVNSFTLAAGQARRDLFTSCAPCAMCLGAILWSGVKRLVWAGSGEDARALGFDEGPVFPESYQYLQEAGITLVPNMQRETAQDIFHAYVQAGGVIYNG
jgi:tRNA(Arg) A34 adenosine deaminase TadA